MSIDLVLQRELTDEQRAAAVDPAREVLCLACAGSGKSRTLFRRDPAMQHRNIRRRGLFTEGLPPLLVIR